MFPIPRVGIRAKLLLFYSIAILAVIVLDLAIQVVSYNAVREFQTQLTRYHAIHRLRLGLSTHYSTSDRRLREGSVPDDRELDQEQHDFLYGIAQLESEHSESLASYFNLQATHRGMEAYFRVLTQAIKRRAAKDKDWYQDMAYAGRIAVYLDAYLSALLSDSLKTGESRYQAIVSRINTVRSFTLGALVLFSLFFGVAALAFSGSVAAPIKRLAAAAERIAAGDLDVEEVRAQTGDEVEVLARAFNTMSRSIKTMVADLQGTAELERRLREEERELMEKEHALREAQFISLQDQIRPHFLFNALNTIARTALIEGATETETLAVALGRLFRYALGAPESMVPLREELSVVEEYLKFQRLRFGERLRWAIAAPKSAQDVLVPRFTLQPFVENAVRHGIEPLEAGGSVAITVRRSSGRLYLRVHDTGIGMAAVPTREEEGIGISNVRKRLELRYGTESRLSIHSSRGAGTQVRLSFPAEPVDPPGISPHGSQRSGT